MHEDVVHPLVIEEGPVQQQETVETVETMSDFPTYIYNYRFERKKKPSNQMMPPQRREKMT